MRKSFFLTGTFIFLFSMLAHAQFTETVKSQFIKDWERAKAYTLEYLDAMPKDKYGFKDFTSDTSLSVASLKMKQRKNLYLFFKEVINNAAKHSGAKNVSVRILKKEAYVGLIVRDDGKGFASTDQTFNGNGMSTLKKRAEELGGHFKIQSRLNEGTEVDLKFKIT